MGRVASAKLSTQTEPEQTYSFTILLLWLVSLFSRIRAGEIDYAHVEFYQYHMGILGYIRFV